MDKRNDAGFVSIPESYTRRQLNALYREIPLKDTTSRLLRKYFNGRAVSPLSLGMRDIRREALHATEIYTAAIANI